MDLQGFGHRLLSGTWVTLQLALASLAVGLELGLIGAWASLAPFAPLRWAAVPLGIGDRGTECGFKPGHDGNLQ